MQTGSRDEIRGRALTVLMSGTMLVQAIGTILAGGLMPADGARWVWGASGGVFLIAAVLGYVLAREPAAATAPAAV